MISAGTGEEGVEAAVRERPFFIIMDIQLPGIDGLEATRRIRASEANGHIPIIAMTSFAMRGDMERVLAAGCTGYFEKPIDPLTIVEKIEKIIQNSQYRSQNKGKERGDTGVRMKRPAAKTFQDLIVWQKAHSFVLSIYKYSEDFPKKETYALASQIRRAAVSVPANIAEGFKKKGKADKARFLNIAQGSLEECRYCSILAQDLGYGDMSELMIQSEEVSKLLEAYTAVILTSGF